jgi:hypothetical protein
MPLFPARIRGRFRRANIPGAVEAVFLEPLKAAITKEYGVIEMDEARIPDPDLSRIPVDRCLRGLLTMAALIGECFADRKLT